MTTEAGPTPSQETVAAHRTADQPGDDAEIPRSSPEPTLPPAAPEQPPASGGLPQLLGILGAVVAPATLLSAVLYFFGWVHAFYFFDYFGVHSTLLGLTAQDYVQRSVDGLFVPLAVVACAVLLGVWGHAWLRAWSVAGLSRRVLDVALPVAMLGGLALVGIGLSSMLGRHIVTRPLAAAPLSLAVGVVLLAYTVRLRRTLTAGKGAAGRGAPPAWVAAAEWAGVFVLVGLSLFWAANDYAATVGVTRARQFVAEMPSYPTTVVYSASSLSLSDSGVREVRCEDPDAAYPFRYDGLALVLQSGDQYVLIPRTWSRTSGVAIVLPRSDALRLEFVPASAGSPTQPPAC